MSICELNSVPVSSCLSSLDCTFSKSVNSKGCNVLKNNLAVFPLKDVICSNPSIKSCCNGLITILSNNTKAFFNSSALLPKPFALPNPKSKPLVIECETIILRSHSVERY